MIEGAVNPAPMIRRGKMKKNMIHPQTGEIIRFNFDKKPPNFYDILIHRGFKESDSSTKKKSKIKTPDNSWTVSDIKVYLKDKNIKMGGNLTKKQLLDLI